MFKAVFWDFGGVITESPFEAFNQFELENQLPKDFIRNVNTRNFNDNAWAKFERNEITLEQFDLLFAEESAFAGHRIEGGKVVPLLAVKPRPIMVKALAIVAQQFTTACITNNVPIGHGPGMQTSAEEATAISNIMALFNYVFESSKMGFRKPDPRIYQIACETTSIAPQHIIYLDDLGVNLKPAKQMGMQTIKVTDAKKALTELEILLNIKLMD